MNDTRLIALPGDSSWDGARHVGALDTLWPLLGRRIAFYRRLVDLTANVKAALLLSQSIYWTCHGRDIADAGGWFLKTTEQWEMETGLTLREQSAAREVLRELAILNEQRIGFPASLHFRLCLDRIEALLGARLGRPAFGLDWADGAAVAELLGPSLTYYRRLAGIGGGVHAGLLLSRALYLTRLQLRGQTEAWIGNSIDLWRDQIGLTRRQQETVRQELASAGIWQETRIGVPPRRLARIHLDCLLALLAGDESGHAARIVLPSSPECGIPTISIHQKGETSMQESRIHVSTEPPDQFRQSRHSSIDNTAITVSTKAPTQFQQNPPSSIDKNASAVAAKTPLQFQQNHPPSLDKSAKLSKQRSTRVLVQPPLTREIIPCTLDAQGGGGDLILPQSLLPDERAAALVLVHRCAPHAQALLDELAARMQANAVRTSPVAYLRGLVRRALAGQFVPELGQRLATERRRNEEERVSRQQRETAEPRHATVSEDPERQARLESRRAQLRKIASALKAGLALETRS